MWEEIKNLSIVATLHRLNDLFSHLWLAYSQKSVSRRQKLLKEGIFLCVSLYKNNLAGEDKQDYDCKEEKKTERK